MPQFRGVFVILVSFVWVFFKLVCHPQSSPIADLLFAEKEEFGSSFLALCCSNNQTPGAFWADERSPTPTLLSKHLEKNTAYNADKITSLFSNI